MDIFNPTRECSHTTHVVNNCLCIHNQIHRHPRGPTVRTERPTRGWIGFGFGFGWATDRSTLDASGTNRERRVGSTASLPTDSPTRARASDATRPKRLRRIHFIRDVAVALGRRRTRTRDDDDDARKHEGWKEEEGEKYFYEEFARTWTLVALNAATRPTKEEARSADILVISVRAGVRTGVRSSREEACIRDSSTTYTYNT